MTMQYRRMIMRSWSRAGIIGASGLHRRRAAAPARRSTRDFDSSCATGDTQAGIAAADAVPVARRGLPRPASFEPFDRRPRVDGLDVVFLGLPHEASMALAPQLVGRVGCVVDLSAAFRLKDASLYPTWYGFEHDQPELLAEAVYGLPELHRDELQRRRADRHARLLRRRRRRWRWRRCSTPG